MKSHRALKVHLSHFSRLTHIPRFDTLSVLTYHSIGQDDPYSISEEKFHAQMKYLCESRAVQALDWAQPLPVSNVPTALVTFDDGYEDNYSNAAPILREFGIKALFFITSGFVGGALPINRHFEAYRRLKPLSWPQLESLLNEGHSLGLHGHTHQLFSDMTKDQAEQELLTSLELFASRLGVRPTSFAYPAGQLDQQRSDLDEFFERHGILHVFTSEHQTMRYSAVQSHHRGVMTIPRLSIDAEDSPSVFREKLFGYWDLVATAQRVRAGLRSRLRWRR